MPIYCTTKNLKVPRKPLHFMEKQELGTTRLFTCLLVNLLTVLFASMCAANLQVSSLNYCTTHPDKVKIRNPPQGVTIPSQRRYVYYFGYALHNSLRYSIKTFLLRKFRFEGIPSFATGGGCCESTFCTPQVFGMYESSNFSMYVPVTGVVVAYYCTL